ncbi:MAG: alkaline phosphatase family protein, partial [Candidatus Omnitrophica bacterium]|nr:alkaline phosphatase family protein [Candidatus Omnitrophota bacterium]
ESDKESRGKIISVKPDNNLIETYIFGPKVVSKNGFDGAKIPLKIAFKPGNNLIDVELQNKKFSLEKGTWSKWQEVSFKIGWGKRAYGLVKLYLKSIDPDFELYLSPINFDPRRPLFDISYPKKLSKELACESGLYFTQGMPHDTWALTEGRINEKTFLEEVDFILDENMKIFERELSNFKQGVFFFYLETLDIIQHMFWRYIEQKSSLYEENSPYKDTVYKYYEKIDDVLGKILEKVDSDTTLIVLSDHGFSSFRRSVNLNRFLLEMNLLYLKEGYDEGRELFEGIDWSKTSAYALGFGGIYLNNTGKGRWGIVDETVTKNVTDDIYNRLKQWRDPQTGEMVVNTVYKKKDIFNGPYAEDGPDLFVGFNKGYRSSWKTALGMVPKELIEDNEKKWSGDHLIDPKLVPGVIFVNKKLDLVNPSILDVAPTILKVFEISKPEEMVGKSLWH